MEDVGSEIKFHPALKWVIAVAILSILVWAWAKLQMEAIKENLSVLRKEHEDKLKAQLREFEYWTSF